MNFNWWQTITAGIVIFIIGFGVRHVTYKCPVMSTKADTVYVPAYSLQKTDSSIVKAVPKRFRKIDFKAPSEPVVPRTYATPYHLQAQPEDTTTETYNVYERTDKGTIKDSAGTDIIKYQIRATAYVMGDSAIVVIEKNIIPLPYKIIIPKQLASVPQQEEKSFIEQPLFAFTVGGLTAIGMVYLFKDMFKK